MGDRQISSTGGFPPDLGARRSLRAELDARRVELGELDDEEEQRRVDASVLWEAVPGTRTTNYADSARFARFVVNGPHGERCVVHRAHSGVAYPENAGGEVTVCDGCVDLPNLPGRAYDYRVGFTVDWDPAAHWAGQQTPPPKLRVTEVTVAVRDGAPLSR